MSLARRVSSSVVVLNMAGILTSGLAVVAGLGIATKPTTSDTTTATTTTSTQLASTSVSPRAPRRASALKVEGGRITLAPSDWESVGKVQPMDAHVAAFWLDRFEVTYGDWLHCNTCTPITISTDDPTLPVVHVSPERAQGFCREQNGRLPTRAEWTIAASTSQNYRYPWGQTGLVCRTAVFGMVNGPCAFARAAQPVGQRPGGATPTGIHDLAGNVAEWASDGERFVALGGSFRSTLAGQLKVWALEQTHLPRDDIGFRCAYDSDEPR